MEARHVGEVDGIRQSSQPCRNASSGPRCSRSSRVTITSAGILVIDLKEVSYVSSAGWGIFVGEIKRIRSQKGDLFLVSMSPEVAEVFELLEFDSILKFFPTVDQAVQKGFAKVRAAKGAGKIAAEPGRPRNPSPRKALSRLPRAAVFSTPRRIKPPKNPGGLRMSLNHGNGFDRPVGF